MSRSSVVSRKISDIELRSSVQKALNKAKGATTAWRTQTSAADSPEQRKLVELNLSDNPTRSTNVPPYLIAQDGEKFAMFETADGTKLHVVEVGEPVEVKQAVKEESATSQLISMMRERRASSTANQPPKGLDQKKSDYQESTLITNVRDDGLMATYTTFDFSLPSEIASPDRIRSSMGVERSERRNTAEASRRSKVYKHPIASTGPRPTSAPRTRPSSAHHKTRPTSAHGTKKFPTHTPERRLARPQSAKVSSASSTSISQAAMSGGSVVQRELEEDNELGKGWEDVELEKPPQVTRKDAQELLGRLHNNSIGPSYVQEGVYSSSGGRGSGSGSGSVGRPVVSKETSRASVSSMQNTKKRYFTKAQAKAFFGEAKVDVTPNESLADIHADNPRGSSGSDDVHTNTNPRVDEGHPEGLQGGAKSKTQELKELAKALEHTEASARSEAEVRSQEKIRAAQQQQEQQFRQQQKQVANSDRVQHSRLISPEPQEEESKLPKRRPATAGRTRVPTSAAASGAASSSPASSRKRPVSAQAKATPEHPPEAPKYDPTHSVFKLDTGNATASTEDETLSIGTLSPLSVTPSSSPERERHRRAHSGEQVGGSGTSPPRSPRDSPRAGGGYNHQQGDYGGSTTRSFSTSTIVKTARPDAQPVTASRLKRRPKSAVHRPPSSYSTSNMASARGHHQSSSSKKRRPQTAGRERDRATFTPQAPLTSRPPIRTVSMDSEAVASNDIPIPKSYDQVEEFIDQEEEGMPIHTPYVTLANLRSELNGVVEDVRNGSLLDKTGATKHDFKRMLENINRQLLASTYDSQLKRSVPLSARTGDGLRFTSKKEKEQYQAMCRALEETRQATAKKKSRPQSAAPRVQEPTVNRTQSVPSVEIEVEKKRGDVGGDGGAEESVFDEAPQNATDVYLSSESEQDLGIIDDDDEDDDGDDTFDVHANELHFSGRETSSRPTSARIQVRGGPMQHPEDVEGVIGIGSSEDDSGDGARGGDTDATDGNGASGGDNLPHAWKFRPQSAPARRQPSPLSQQEVPSGALSPWDADDGGDDEHGHVGMAVFGRLKSPSPYRSKKSPSPTKRSRSRPKSAIPLKSPQKQKRPSSEHSKVGGRRQEATGAGSGFGVGGQSTFTDAVIGRLTATRIPPSGTQNVTQMALEHISKAEKESIAAVQQAILEDPHIQADKQRVKDLELLSHRSSSQNEISVAIRGDGASTSVDEEQQEHLEGAEGVTDLLGEDEFVDVDPNMSEELHTLVKSYEEYNGVSRKQSEDGTDHVSTATYKRYGSSSSYEFGGKAEMPRYLSTDTTATVATVSSTSSKKSKKGKRRPDSAQAKLVSSTSHNSSATEQPDRVYTGVFAPTHIPSVSVMKKKRRPLSANPRIRSSENIVEFKPTGQAAEPTVRLRDQSRSSTTDPPLRVVMQPTLVGVALSRGLLGQKLQVPPRESMARGQRQPVRGGGFRVGM